MTDPTSLRRHRQTRIVATLGPATSSPEAIAALWRTGVDVFRLNFSHGTHETHGQNLASIRALEAELGRPIAILADLQGPKLRIGRFAAGPIALEPGQRLRLDLDPAPGDATRVALPHPEVMAVLNPGDEVLLDDGRVRLRVTEKGPAHLDTSVVSGRTLSDRKGLNVPGVRLPIAALTEKDRADLAFALDRGVDWVALSFVQRPEDVAEARRLTGQRAALLVKLEKPQALDHLEELVELADGLMVARGDLGVEIPAEDVPSLQKSLVRRLRHAGKPVIVATQMLESMVAAPTPTRAEASDVATAIYDGADAVMLSAETASGQYPLEAVAIMDRIARRTEADPLYRRVMDADHPDPEHTSADAISAAARQVAATIDAVCVATFTMTGSTTLRMARERPAQPILCLTPAPAVARRLVLSYGVHAVHAPGETTVTAMVERACGVAVAQGLARPGQRMVVTAGVPFGTPGSTNMLRIAWVS